MSTHHNYNEKTTEAQEDLSRYQHYNDPALQDPDSSDAPIHLNASDEMQTEIAGNLLHDSIFMEAVADIFTGQQLNSKPLQICTTIAVEFFKQYGELASKTVIANEIRKKYKDSKELPHYLAVLQSLEYLTLHNRQYYIDQTIELTKICKAQEAFVKWTENLKKNPKAAYTEYLNSLTQIEKLGVKKKSSFLSFADLKLIADEQQQDFLVENWLEFGSLGMLSGLPFSGKSCIVSELVSGICKTGQFGNKTIDQNCSILSIDLENREKITVKRLEAAVDGDLTCLEGKYLRARLSEDELPLDAVKVESLINDAKLATDSDKILVVVDTFRSAFAANEMEVDSVKDLLYPLQRVAQRTNAAILILHHRPKSGAKYSGQTSIPGALDYLWVWESCKESYRGLLTLEGERSNAIESSMVWQFRDGKNVFVGSSGSKKPEDFETEFHQVLAGIFSEHPKIKQSDLLRLVQEKWSSSPGKMKLLDLLKSQEGKIFTVTKGDRNTSYYELFGWQSA